MDISKNFNINNLINILYDYFYNKNNKTIFRSKPTNIKDIEDIKNIKLICPESKQNYYINNIFNTNVKFTRKLYNRYIFTRNDTFNSDIILSLYNTDDKYENIKDECNNHMKYNYLLTEFLVYKQTKHIILPIFNIDLRLGNLKMFLNKYFAEGIFSENNKILDLSDNYIVKVNINEHFFKKTTLDEALTDELLKSWNEEHYLSLFFQIIHTLAIIRKKYENFNHNNLVLDNISCYILDKNVINDHIYYYNDKEYIIPNCGIDIKFDFFDDVTINKNIIEDIETFFNSFKKHNIVSKYLNIKKNIKISNFILDCINIKDPNLIMSNIDFPVFNKKNNKNKNDQNDLISYGSRKLESKLNIVKNQRVISNIENSDSLSDTDTPINNYNIIKSSRKTSRKHSKKSSKKHSKKSSKKHSKKSSKRSKKVEQQYQQPVNKMAGLFGMNTQNNMYMQQQQQPQFNQLQHTNMNPSLQQYNIDPSSLQSLNMNPSLQQYNMNQSLQSLNMDPSLQSLNMDPSLNMNPLLQQYNMDPSLLQNNQMIDNNLLTQTYMGDQMINMYNPPKINNNMKGFGLDLPNFNNKINDININNNVTTNTLDNNKDFFF